MRNYPPKLEALRSAVESRNWALVELALDSLEKSLTDAVSTLVGTPGDEQYRNRAKEEMKLLSERGAVGYQKILKSLNQCKHINIQYGRCVLPQGHGPFSNSGGVFYAHQYQMQGSYGNLDVREAIYPDLGTDTDTTQTQTTTHIGTCLVRDTGTCNCSANNDSSDESSSNLISENKGQDSEEVTGGTHATPPLPTSPHHHAKVTHVVEPQDPDKQAALIEQDRQAVAEVARLYLASQFCPRCGKDLRGGGEKGHWTVTGPREWCVPVSRPVPDRCIRYNACRYPRHSAAENCVMP